MKKITNQQFAEKKRYEGSNLATNILYKNGGVSWLDACEQIENMTTHQVTNFLKKQGYTFIIGNWNWVKAN